MNSANIRILHRQTDVTRFYNSASIVLNLSDKVRFIETFGLTVLEAMSAGLPVIVPTVGGIAEMVSDGENGYRIDVQDLDSIEEAIDTLLGNKELYNRLSEQALQQASNYDIGSATDRIMALLDD